MSGTQVIACRFPWVERQLIFSSQYNLRTSRVVMLMLSNRTGVDNPSFVHTVFSLLAIRSGLESRSSNL